MNFKLYKTGAQQLKTAHVKKNTWMQDPRYTIFNQCINKESLSSVSDKSKRE